MPVSLNSLPIPCGWVMPTKSANPTSAHPNASSTLPRTYTLALRHASDVNPGGYHDVLDVERVPHDHLDEDAGHREQQKTGYAKPHRAPLLQQLGTSARERRPRIIGGAPAYPPVEQRHTDHEVAANQGESEQGGQRIVAEPEHIWQ